MFSTAAVIAAATIFGLTYSLSAPLIALDLDARGYSETFIGFNANPELWVASQLRKHAEAMAWTPGLVLDYARALRVAINPPPLGIVTLTALTRNVYRGIKERRQFIARIRARAAAASTANAAKAGAAAVKGAAKSAAARKTPGET
jgi:hypothetical protein